MPPKKPSEKTTTKRKAVPREAAKRAAKGAAAIRVAPIVSIGTDDAGKSPPPVSEAEGVGRYWEGVGRRKTAIARVRLFTRGERGMWVNGKVLAEYFPQPKHQKTASEAIDTMNTEDRFRATIHVRGGGTSAQAEAVRHASARALILFNGEFRKRLKRAGFLTRDPRAKERRKFGLKKARRAPQWGKR